MQKDITERRKGNCKRNSKKKRVIRFFATAAAVGVLFWLNYFVERDMDEADSIQD